MGLTAICWKKVLGLTEREMTSEGALRARVNNQALTGIKKGTFALCRCPLFDLESPSSYFFIII